LFEGSEAALEYCPGWPEADIRSVMGSSRSTHTLLQLTKFRFLSSVAGLPCPSEEVEAQRAGILRAAERFETVLVMTRGRADIPYKDLCGDVDKCLFPLFGL